MGGILCCWLISLNSVIKQNTTCRNTCSLHPPPFCLLTGNALLEDDKVFHLVRPADELDEVKSKRGSIKDKSMTKAITEIYLTRLLSVKVNTISISKWDTSTELCRDVLSAISPALNPRVKNVFCFILKEYFNKTGLVAILCFSGKCH